MVENPYKIGDEVLVNLKEIKATVKGKVTMIYNHKHTVINFGNLYIQLLPKWYQNEWVIDNELIKLKENVKC